MLFSLGKCCNSFAASCWWWWWWLLLLFSFSLKPKLSLRWKIKNKLGIKGRPDLYVNRVLIGFVWVRPKHSPPFSRLTIKGIENLWSRYKSERKSLLMKSENVFFVAKKNFPFTNRLAPSNQMISIKRLVCSASVWWMWLLCKNQHLFEAVAASIPITGKKDFFFCESSSFEMNYSTVWNRTRLKSLEKSRKFHPKTLRTSGKRLAYWNWMRFSHWFPKKKDKTFSRSE